MRLLVLGSDPSILQTGSAMAKRTLDYGKLTEGYSVIVAANRVETKKLADNIVVYGLKSRFKFFLLLKIYFLAIRLAKKEKYDLISSPDAYYLGLVSLFLSWRLSIPVQAQIHGWEKENFLRKMIARQVARKADGIRVVSLRLKRQLIDNFGVTESKIAAVPIHVDYSNKIITPKTEKKIGDKIIFLTISRLVKVKNIPLQIKAFRDIISKYSNAELWIVGSGPEEARLKQLAVNLEVDDLIKFWGHQHDVSRFYRQADIFLLTSNSEGWGMVIIEAASYGLPIIMTNVGCAGEVIMNKQSGLVIPIGDSDALVSAMDELIASPAKREELGRQAGLAIKRLPDFQQTLIAYRESWARIINNQQTNEGK